MGYLLTSGYHIWSRHLRWSLQPMIVYSNMDMEIIFQKEKLKVEPRISTIQVFYMIKMKILLLTIISDQFR